MVAFLGGHIYVNAAGSKVDTCLLEGTRILARHVEGLLEEQGVYGSAQRWMLHEWRPRARRIWR